MIMIFVATVERWALHMQRFPIHGFNQLRRERKRPEWEGGSDDGKQCTITTVCLVSTFHLLV